MTMTRGQHLLGTVLGSCVLERLLGYGGSSAVYLAQQQSPERKVAVKVFLPRHGMSLQMQRDFYVRFLHEADAASQLNHPHILPIYSYGEQNGLPYIVMPYMPGGTLSEYMVQHGPLSLQEAQWFLEQVASALDYAHQHGCIHCDVKPANMLLDTDGRVMLSDFGIAYMVPTEETTQELKTKPADSLMGTPDYISPEQALGESLSGPSDVYSLGITLFSMLAKQLPFKSDSTIALALMHVHDKPPSLALLRLDVTPEIDRVVQKALAKRPEDRYQTAGEFAAAFAQAVASADEWQATSQSGKRALALAAHTDLNVSKDASQPIVIPAPPKVRVAPTTSPRGVRWRLFTLSIILSLLLGSLAFATTSWLLNAHPKTTLTATATPSPVSKKGTEDELTDYTNWPSSSTYFFKQQQYHIINTSRQDVALALYANHHYDNFRLTVTMAEIHDAHDGADYYGVVFRSSSDQSHYYLFEVITGSNPQYAFWRYDGQWKSLSIGPAPTLHVQGNQGNTITIEAQNNTFTFLINNQPVGNPISDSSKTPLTSGAIGLYVEDQGAEVAFSHLYVQPLVS